MCKSLLSGSFRAVLRSSPSSSQPSSRSSFADTNRLAPHLPVNKSLGHAIIKLGLVIKASYRPWLLADFRKAFHMNLNAMNC